MKRYHKKKSHKKRNISIIIVIVIICVVLYLAFADSYDVVIVDKQPKTSVWEHIEENNDLSFKEYIDKYNEMPISRKSGWP